MLMFNFGLLKAVGRLGGQHLREECHTLRVKELQNALPWNMIGKLADIHIRLLYRHPWQKKKKTKKTNEKQKIHYNRNNSKIKYQNRTYSKVIS